jgi:hypothetical protein
MLDFRTREHNTLHQKFSRSAIEKPPSNFFTSKLSWSLAKQEKKTCHFNRMEVDTYVLLHPDVIAKFAATAYLQYLDFLVFQ